MSSSITVANFTTAEQQLLKEYREKGRPFLFQTRPYHSTITIAATFVPLLLGTSALVIKKDQRIRCFDYAINDMRDDGFGGDMKATFADTNLTKPRQTNGTEDFVINSVRTSVRSVRVKFTDTLPGVTDPIVIGAFAGRKHMLDIGANYRPPQLDSPLRLEDSLGGFLRNFLSMAFVFDGEQNTRIGLASQTPDFQAASLLKSAGLPTESNKFELPEGWLWRKTGKDHDTELSMFCVVEDDIVYVVNNATWPDGETPTQPKDAAIDMVVELGGFSLKYPSTN